MIGQADFIPHTTPHGLSSVDRLLLYSALALVVTVGCWWAAGRGRDPLDGAPPRPNRLHEDAVLFTILVYLTAALVISSLVQLVTGQTEGAATLVAVGNGAQLAGLGACLLVAATRFDGGVHRFCFGGEGLKPGLWSVTALVAILMALGLCPVVSEATVSVMVRVAPGVEFRPHPTISALRDGTQPIGIVVALLAGAVLVAPLAEELFFRGVLQTYLVGQMRSRWPAIVLAALAFGAVHYTQPYAVAALVLLGVLLGYAYERTGSLLPPVVIHALFNLKTLVWEAVGAAPT
jgi:membrane protease YdiL (CAAX protease family)